MILPRVRATAGKEQFHVRKKQIYNYWPDQSSEHFGVASSKVHIKKKIGAEKPLGSRHRISDKEAHSIVEKTKIKGKPTQTDKR